jgi:hypothetical protein
MQFLDALERGHASLVPLKVREVNQEELAVRKTYTITCQSLDAPNESGMESLPNNITTLEEEHRGDNRIFIDISFYTIVLPYTSSLPTLRKRRRKGILDLSWVNVLF